jgi:hypothetical protein
MNFFSSNASTFARKRFFSLPFVAMVINIKLHNSNRICCEIRRQAQKLELEQLLAIWVLAQMALISWF